MNRKGVCYDAGRMLDGRDWRPVFDRREVRRELEIIAGDLHCNAVKIHARTTTSPTPPGRPRNFAPNSPAGSFSASAGS